MATVGSTKCQRFCASAPRNRIGHTATPSWPSHSIAAIFALASRDYRAEVGEDVKGLCEPGGGAGQRETASSAHQRRDPPDSVDAEALDFYGVSPRTPYG